MVIQHNIPALNAHRNLGINNAATAKNLEKLSSGYRINRAADDAAGLAISEKMRGQIRGLGMAEQNAKNGISLIQTAEGALSETHSILQRMRELAVQSSNGTYQDEDRMMITKEFNELKGELDRIAESTHYNGIKLLDGSLASGATTGSNAVAPLTAQLVSPFDKDALKIAKGALVAATSQVYTVNNGNIQSLLNEMTASGIDLSKITTEAKLKSALADFFGVDEADYTWGTDAAGTTPVLLSDPAGTAAIFTVSATVGLSKGLSTTLDLNFAAVDPGATDPNQSKIVTASSGVGTTTALAYVSKKGVDAYNKIDFIVGDLGSDDNLIGKQIVINGKTYTFKGDGDKTMDGTTPVAKSGDKLADGSYAIYIGDVQQPTPSTTDADRQDAIAKQIADAVNVVEWHDASDWNAVTGVLTEQATKIANGYITTAGTTGTAAAGTVNVLAAVGAAGTGKATIDPGLFKKTVKNEVAASGGLVFQIGANGGADQRVSMSVNNMDSKSLGVSSMAVEYNVVTGMSVAQSSIDTIENANKAIDVMDGATNMVSAQRASLGALQNRLESALNTLGIAKENLTSAESTIRDVDMAKEMMEFTKNNILVQAAQAMLAQANSLPQGVLQLLR